MHFTEDDFENAILELFREQLGYDYVYGPNVIRDYAGCFAADQSWSATGRY